MPAAAVTRLTHSVVNLRVISRVVTALLSRMEPIRKEACRLVANVATSTDSRIQKIVDRPRVVRVLLTMLAEDTQGAREEAAWAIGSAVAGGIAEQIQALVGAGGG
jgi:hypothetical protein